MACPVHVLKPESRLSTLPLSAALGAAGPCPEIVVGDKVLKLGHPTQAAKARYCAAIIQAEVRKYKALEAAGVWTAAKVDERTERLGGQIERNEHQPGGPLFESYSLGSDAATGLILFLWSLLVENHPTLTVKEVEQLSGAEPVSVRLAIRQVVPSFFEWTLTARGVPPEKLAEVMPTVLAKIDQLLPSPSGSPPATSTASS